MTITHWKWGKFRGKRRNVLCIERLWKVHVMLIICNDWKVISFLFFFVFRELKDNSSFPCEKEEWMKNHLLSLFPPILCVHVRHHVMLFLSDLCIIMCPA